MAKKEENVETLADLNEEQTLEERQKGCEADIKVALDKYGFGLGATMKQSPLGDAIVASPTLIDLKAKPAE